MTLIRNISSIIVNLSKLLYYKFRKITIYVEQYILEWHESFKKSLKYIDEPRYIERDYEEYDYIDTYQKNERNKHGFPKQIKRGN